MYRKPALLTERHIIENFDCGKMELNAFLMEKALFNQREDYARTYVIAHDDDRVVGYYSICASALLREIAPRQIGGHGAPATIPAILLARLAVDKSAHRQGLGELLLRHAFETAVAFTEQTGSKAMLVHAKDDEAVRFYSHHGFQPAKGVDRTMLRSLRGIAESLVAARNGI